MRVILILLGTAVVIGLAAPSSAAEKNASAYAGQETRPIKALSENDIASLRNVLALARELRLTDAQAGQVTAIHDRMSASARPLGAELIDREGLLDQLFAKAEITPERLTAEVAAIGEIQGRLRAVHLAAHLETRAIMKAEQIAEYDRLRGYASAGALHGNHPAGHSH